MRPSTWATVTAVPRHMPHGLGCSLAGLALELSFICQKLACLTRTTFQSAFFTDTTTGQMRLCLGVFQLKYQSKKKRPSKRHPPSPVGLIVSAFFNKHVFLGQAGKRFSLARESLPSIPRLMYCQFCLCKEKETMWASKAGLFSSLALPVDCPWGGRPRRCQRCTLRQFCARDTELARLAPRVCNKCTY